MNLNVTTIGIKLPNGHIKFKLKGDASDETGDCCTLNYKTAPRPSTEDVDPEASTG